MQYRETIHAAAAASQQRMPTTLDSDEINAASNKRLQPFKMGGVICAARHCQKNLQALPSEHELIDDGDTNDEMLTRLQLDDPERNAPQQIVGVLVDEV